MASLVVALVIAGSVAFAFFMTSKQEEHRQQFIEECQQQGGQGVTLRHRTYCIIDGVRTDF